MRLVHYNVHRKLHDMYFHFWVFITQKEGNEALQISLQKLGFMIIHDCTIWLRCWECSTTVGLVHNITTFFSLMGVKSCRYTSGTWWERYQLMCVWILAQYDYDVRSTAPQWVWYTTLLHEHAQSFLWWLLFKPCWEVSEAVQTPLRHWAREVPIILRMFAQYDNDIRSAAPQCGWYTTLHRKLHERAQSFLWWLIFKPCNGKVSEAVQIHVNSFKETRQSKQLRPKTTPFFSREKMSCLGRDSNPRHSAC